MSVRHDEVAAGTATTPARREIPLLDFLWLEITGKCNLTCGHCYAESGPHRSLRGAMGLDDWLAVLAESASLGCRRVQFIGGEPTLHPDLSTMIEAASTRGYQIEVFTNATTLTPRLAGFFAEHGVNLATSFYSSDAVIHERITQRAGSFEKTVRGIRLAVGAGINIRAGVIETSHNRGDLDGAMSLLGQLGVRRMGIDRERGVGRGLDGGSHAPSTITVADPMAELCGQCWKGKLCITADAAVYPCVFARFLDLGDPRRGVREVLRSLQLQAFRADMAARFPVVPVTSPHRHGETVACQPDIPCNPLQCEPAGCNPAACNPGHCEPGDPCSPSEPHCLPQTCAPREPCVPNTA